MHIQSDDGYDRIEIFNLQIGEVSVIDPLGPDEYGYYIYDSGDDGYDLAPVYDWVEIDPSSGGNGTDLNLSNSGNGNWSGNGPIDWYAHGYGNTTSAIDAVQFKMSSGNTDAGVIKLYGIS